MFTDVSNSRWVVKRVHFVHQLLTTLQCSASSPNALATYILYPSTLLLSPHILEYTPWRLHQHQAEEEWEGGGEVGRRPSIARDPGTKVYTSKLECETGADRRVPTTAKTRLDNTTMLLQVRPRASHLRQLLPPYHSSPHTIIPTIGGESTADLGSTAS